MMMSFYFVDPSITQLNFKIRKYEQIRAPGASKLRIVALSELFSVLSLYSRMSAITTEPRYKYSPAADFRSDTVTIPEDGMFEAMKRAHLGDDVYNASETTLDLEQYVAKMCGKEAGLFVSSGTQGNQICLRTHLQQPPYTILCDARGHIINYESAGIAINSQAMSTPVKPSNGLHLSLEDVEKNLIMLDDIHHADTKIISLENTLNGVIFPFQEMAKISQRARELDIRIHLDGARLWEASAASGISLEEYGSLFDSMSLCLSKGIGAPVGTVIVGTSQFIKKAKFFRKIMGGAMRQIGILTGAARYALDTHFPDVLKKVHARAATTAKYATSRGYELYVPADTNMVWLDLDKTGIKTADWIAKGTELGLTLGGGRCVFHHQITDAGQQKLHDLIDLFAAAKGT
ncbi:hypothetical protein MRB53_042368 [Persea americana]|nr:hypothetical protein MRB53_042368 [Persea americana]